MKHVLFTVIAGALLLTQACRSVNQELVSKMEADRGKIQQSLPGIEASYQKAADLVVELEAAPPGLKISAEKYSENYQMAVAVKGRYDNLQRMCKQYDHDLDSLISNYSDGNIKEEEVAAVVKVISGEVEGFTKAVERTTPVYERIAGEYKASLDKWNALSDAEKEAILPAGNNSGPGSLGNTPANKNPAAPKTLSRSSLVAPAKQ